MKTKLNEGAIIVGILFFIFIVGVLLGRFVFPKEISEQKMKKQCEDAGGRLDIGYDGLYPLESDYLVYRCSSPSKILWTK